MKHTTFLYIGLLYLVLACGPSPPVGMLDAEDQYLIAKEEFDHHKYDEAILEFHKLVWNFPGSDFVDEAQFYLAECHRYIEDYPTAIVEYGRLLRNYSQSPFVPAAKYQLALCYYEQSLPPHLDQDFTHKTIQELHLFLEDHPNSEYVPQAEELLLAARTKIAQKDYDNAKLYYKMNNYESAIIYIEQLLEEYADTKWAGDAQYLLGECFRRQGKWEQALNAYRQTLGMDTSRKLQHQTQKRIHQVEERLK